MMSLDWAPLCLWKKKQDFELTCNIAKWPCCGGEGGKREKERGWVAMVEKETMLPYLNMFIFSNIGGVVAENHFNL